MAEITLDLRLDLIVSRISKLTGINLDYGHSSYMNGRVYVFKSERQDVLVIDRWEEENVWKIAIVDSGVSFKINNKMTTQSLEETLSEIADTIMLTQIVN